MSSELFPNTEGRTNEMLSAYLTEYLASDPVDNHFVDIPALDWFMKYAKKMDSCAQYMLPINIGSDPNVSRFAGFDTVPNVTPDTALTVTYKNVNYSGSVPVSYDDKRIAGPASNHVFDVVKHRTKVARATVMDQIATDLLAAATPAKGFTPLAVTVSSTGSTGGLSAASVADWASQEIASGSFVDRGWDDMNNLWAQIVARRGRPKGIITTIDVYNTYKKDHRPDVRYASPGKEGTLNSSWEEVKFLNMPILFDLKATSGVLYMLSPDDLYLAIDKNNNFRSSGFKDVPNQPEGAVANILCTLALVCQNRRTQGKMTGITT